LSTRVLSRRSRPAERRTAPRYGFPAARLCWSRGQAPGPYASRTIIWRASGTTM